MMAPLLRLRGLHFAYPARPPLLAGIDLEVAAGERVALAGANGAGKTTVLHLVVGLQKAQAGEVEAFGQARRRDADFREVRRRAGLLFQDPDDQLFCPTVLEDVAFGPLNLGLQRAEALAAARRALAGLGLDGFEERVTHRLSGGEKRLVALASVLAMRPDVLLLDEPTNALDEAAAARLTEILLRLSQAMIIVSHDQGFVARLASRRVRLQDGRLAAD